MDQGKEQEGISSRKRRKGGVTISITGERSILSYYRKNKLVDAVTGNVAH